jgi:tetratricopeptide (TPR) repeat protein
MKAGQQAGNKQEILTKVKSHLSVHETEKALAEAQGYILANVNDPFGYIALGMVYKKTQRFKDAIMIFDKAIEVDPKIATAFSLRGFCKALLGDLEGAFADSEKARMIDPTDRMARTLREHMERRREMETRTSFVELPAKVVPNNIIPPLPLKPIQPVEIPPLPRPGLQPIEKKIDVPQKWPQGANQTKFISSEMSQAIVNELEAEKESILILVPKMQAVMAALATMQALTDLYEMDGIVVCADRPAKFLKATFAKCSKEVDLVHYLELMTGEEPAGPPRGADSYCQIYDLERLIKVIDEDLEGKAKKHGGEDHFVLWDDASALKYCHEPKAIFRFFETLTDHLVGMDVVHIVLLPTEAASLLQRWPVSSFKSTINVKSSWMSRFK